MCLYCLGLHLHSILISDRILHSLDTAQQTSIRLTPKNDSTCANSLTQHQILTMVMDIAKLKSELEQAKKEYDKARVARLVRMIGKEERNARNRAANAEDAQRKARESFLPYSKSDTPPSLEPVAPNLPPMAYFIELEEQVKREEEARQTAERVRKEEEARKAAERERQEEARRRAQERRQREQDQQRQRESRFRNEQRQREREQQKKSHRSTPPNTPLRTLAPAPAVTMPQIKDWYNFAETCNRARDKVQTFPTPPGGCCGKLTCVSQAKDRANKACECNIRRAFELAGVDSYKKEMLKWHPDKWSRSPEAKRDRFQELAREIFIVLKDM
ncbi:hypothetical protein AC578_4516 [Pseudocercospora eumusae]|uniref:J domain-containing protein n=1 Tax=Pseudocercospora eumusae TaxID=321146 RepID=A0A139GWA5_9PEZI|nr:hypothetical protein AC578_4516 [Pseudocercospora eumusae]